MYLPLWIALKSRRIRLENTISLVRSRFDLPELYVEPVVYSAVSETIARVINRKCLTEIGFIDHMRLLPLPSIADGWKNPPICQYHGQSFLCGRWNVSLRARGKAGLGG